MKTIIEVEILNLAVDEEYFNFDYIITVNGEKRKIESYSDDYCNGMTPKEWTIQLENGLAIEYALRDFQI